MIERVPVRRYLSTSRARRLQRQSGAPLWAGQFDENFTDVFAVQDSISDQVTRVMTPRLNGGEGGIRLPFHCEEPQLIEVGRVERA